MSYYFWRLECVCDGCGDINCYDFNEDIGRHRNRMRKSLAEKPCCQGKTQRIYTHSMFAYECKKCEKRQSETVADSPANKICRWCRGRQQ